MSLETLARSDVVTASPDSSIRDVASMMDEEMVGSVVITEGDEPVGIVTDRDLALAVLVDGDDPESTTAEDVMSGTVHTIGVDAGFYDATERMNERNVRRLPVVDDDGSLVGIITLDDLSELLADEQSELVGVIREQRAPY
ncbi:CBS domain-containing protein [Saliphagus sp. GCM10025334]